MDQGPERKIIGGRIFFGKLPYYKHWTWTHLMRFLKYKLEDMYFDVFAQKKK
jgi:hypothetical protein